MTLIEFFNSLKQRFDLLTIIEFMNFLFLSNTKISLLMVDFTSKFHPIRFPKINERIVLVSSSEDNKTQEIHHRLLSLSLSLSLSFYALFHCISLTHHNHNLLSPFYRQRSVMVPNRGTSTLELLWNFPAISSPSSDDYSSEFSKGKFDEKNSEKESNYRFHWYPLGPNGYGSYFFAKFPKREIFFVIKYTYINMTELFSNKSDISV